MLKADSFWSAALKRPLLCFRGTIVPVVTEWTKGAQNTNEIKQAGKQRSEVRRKCEGEGGMLKRRTTFSPAMVCCEITERMKGTPRIEWVGKWRMKVWWKAQDIVPRATIVPTMCYETMLEYIVCLHTFADTTVASWDAAGHPKDCSLPCAQISH